VKAPHFLVPAALVGLPSLSAKVDFRLAADSHAHSPPQAPRQVEALDSQLARSASPTLARLELPRQDLPACPPVQMATMPAASQMAAELAPGWMPRPPLSPMTRSRVRSSPWRCSWRLRLKPAILGR